MNGGNPSAGPADPERRFELELRWYPAPWRARYGSELAALLADTYGDRAIPRRERVAIARAGLAQRGRLFWSDASWSGGADRVRDGAALVLWAWAFVVVGGIAFSKAAEHWGSALPPRDHPVPAIGFGAVVAAAGVGAVVIAVAVALTLPSFVRFLRVGRWSQVWRPIVVALGLSAATTLAGFLIAVWAHHLTPAQRNGGSGAYGAVVIVGGSLVVATTVAWTIATLHAAVSIDLTPRVVRQLGLLALVLSGATIVVLAGLVTWWTAVAVDASWFLGDGRPGSRHDAVVGDARDRRAFRRSWSCARGAGFVASGVGAARRKPGDVRTLIRGRRCPIRSGLFRT